MPKTLSVLLSLSLLSGLSACDSPSTPSFDRGSLILEASSESIPESSHNAIDGDLDTAWCPTEGDRTRTLTFIMPEGFSFDETNNLVTVSPGFLSSNALIQTIDVWYDSLSEPIDTLSFANSPRPQENDLPIGPVSQMKFQITSTYSEDETATPCIPEINFSGLWGELGSSLQRN